MDPVRHPISPMFSGVNKKMSNGVNKNLRIGLVSVHSFFRPGGVKRHVLALKEEFQKRGISSKIIVPRRSRSEKYGKDIIILGNSLPFPWDGSQSDFSFASPLTIGRLLKKEKFDILHFHNLGILPFQILERSKSIYRAHNALYAPVNILTFHANLERSKFLKIFPFLIPALKKLLKKK